LNLNLTSWGVLSLRKPLNSLPTPFAPGCQHSSTELLRVWLTEDSRISHSANFNFPKSKDVAIYGVALAVLAEDIATEVARLHGLDPEEFLLELIEELEAKLDAYC